MTGNQAQFLHYDWAEFKSLDGAGEPRGTFEGHLAVFGNTDQYNDVIKPGAFSKTLQEAKAAKRTRGDRGFLYPLLWQHDRNQPIGGIIEAKEDDRGLYIRAFVDTDTTMGKMVYSGLSKGYLSGLSIGYVAVKTTWTRDIRNIHEVKLLEGSIVTMPANTEAFVESVKSVKMRLDAWADLLEQALHAGEAIESALATALDETEQSEEVKKGAAISRNRRERIRVCLKQLKDAHTELDALLKEVEPEQPAATQKSDDTEPEQGNATTQDYETEAIDWWLIDRLGSLFPATPAKEQ